MKNLPLVSVGIPTFNRDKVLIDTIKMVLHQDYHNLEIIVADQSASQRPETSKFIKQANDKRLNYYRIKPRSLTAARNFILAKAEGEIIIFIDDDVEITDRFVSQHVEAHAKHHTVTAIAGRVIQDKVTISDTPVHFDKYGLPHGTFNCPKSGPATSFPGGNHSVKSAALRLIGGYHTAYIKMAIREESDAAFQLIKRGYQIYYDAQIPIIHLAAPYGGARIFVQQADNPWFFANDLLFTYRCVEKRLWFISIYKKFCHYTAGPTFKNRVKRRLFFIFGLMVSTYFFIFRPKVVAREVK